MARDFVFLFFGFSQTPGRTTSTVMSVKYILAPHYMSPKVKARINNVLRIQPDLFRLSETQAVTQKQKRILVGEN